MKDIEKYEGGYSFYSITCLGSLVYKASNYKKFTVGYLQWGLCVLLPSSRTGDNFIKNSEQSFSNHYFKVGKNLAVNRFTFMNNKIKLYLLNLLSYSRN